MKKTLLLLLALLLMTGLATAAERQTNVDELNRIAAEYNAKWESWRGPAFEAAQQATTGLYGQINADPNVELIGVMEDGTPVVAKYRNVNAAISTRTDLVQVGGASGYDLDGSTTTGLYHWDGSAANPNHAEFQGRVTIGDNADFSSAHANHTAGTMMATGVSANAKGMANAAQLTSYDWNNDHTEIAQAAIDGAKISSHSYGFGSTGGSYDQWAESYDDILYNAPFYNIAIAGGNAGSNSWYSVYGDAVGKNTICVGNAQDVLNYTGPNSVQIVNSSSVGPTADGRLKPDIMGNGESLYSCSVTGYTTMTGTSMASPNIAGSMFLLVELYEQTHGETPWASTIKGLMINTADECGSNPGPDYKFGWGLMNTDRAAAAIAEDEVLNPNMIQENTLLDGGLDEFTFSSLGDEPIQVTICWTDPPGPIGNGPVLINDLDLRVIDMASGDEYMPWTLNQGNPSAAAVPGDNTLDNVEQVLISDPVPGQYVVQINHEGTLFDGQQAYSLITSGLTGGDAPQYMLYLDPIWQYLPPQGGQIRYDVRFRHNRDFQVPGLTYWAMATMPGGNLFGPVYQVNFTAQPWMDIERTVTQYVPAGAPTGVYTYHAMVGEYPDSVYVAGEFEVIKFDPWGAAEFTGEYELYSGPAVRDWSASGFSVAAADESGEGAARALPDGFELGKAYPNPFNPSTSLSLALPEAADVNVAVFNVAGQQVATLANGRMAAGSHSLTFDAANLAGGVYFIQASAPGWNAVQKVVLMK